MDLPARAQVYGGGAHLGHATTLVIDPVSKTVTHLAVRAGGLLGSERLVPISAVQATHKNRIDLKCDEAAFKKFPHFTETQFIDLDDMPFDDYGHWEGAGMSWPYASVELEHLPVGVDLVPPGECAVTRGMRVDASDGRVGQVDEFAVEPQSGHISHLIMRDRHVFSRRDIFVPVSDIREIGDEHVLLKLSKHEVAQLESLPVRRLWDDRG